MNALLATVLAADSNSGSPLGILILILPIAAIFWLFIGPQRKQRQRQQALASSIAVGDEVVTTGGVVGTITHVEDDVVHLEIDHDVVIRVLKTAVSGTVSGSQPEPAGKSGTSKPAPARRGGLLGSLTGASSSADDEDAGDSDDEPPSAKKNGANKKPSR